MKIAIVGCGYVADYYMLTLRNHPTLQVAGVFDRKPDRLREFCAFHGVPAYATLDALLADGEVGMVLNLTNPASHYEVSLAALEAGRHVYSEKPLAMSIEDAEHLVEVARRRNLALAAAPCSILGESAQAAWTAILDGRLGRVRLAYAEMEDSMVFRESFREWNSPSGAPWPAADEFAVGCTLEHAGYYLTWLCAMFGPVQEITAFSARLFDDKGVEPAGDELAGDFSVSCLRFADGVVARLTCGLVAPKDRSLHIVGTEGTVTVSDGWDNRSGVWLRDREGYPQSRFVPKLGRLAARVERYLPGRHWLGERLPLAPDRPIVPSSSSRMDFARGPAATAEALHTNQPLPISADFSLHITELALVAQNAERFPSPYRPRSTFAPLPAPVATPRH